MDQEIYWGPENKKTHVENKRNVHLIAVMECRRYVAEIMAQNKNDEIQENVTELVFALKNNMDNIGKVLISGVQNSDILFLILHLKHSS